jgi:23S rRNA (cytosine1962-C5)-methyltransferase
MTGAAAPRDGHELLDCGGGRRLERFGPVVVSRPAPVATWDRGLPVGAWMDADLVFDRGVDGPGTWAGTPPDAWTVRFGPVSMRLRPAAGGQVGVFPEHAATWAHAADAIREVGRPVAALNAFGHTGGATLALAAAGASACHVDASRTAVTWARANAAASGLGGRPIRWIVEDVLCFLEREVRRGRRYDAVLLDPPAFGRGGGRATWSFDRDLGRLLDLAGALLSEDPLLVALTAHPAGWTADDLAARLAARPFARRGTVVARALVLRSAAGGRDLPAGLSAWWTPR